MAKKGRTAITPTREENYPQWYQEVIKAADMAEQSVVRGCMVIKPWGYALWENMREFLDRRFKETGHKNAYFPLFIPKRFFEKEAQHVEGFAKECAVVTHSRLEEDGKGGLRPGGQLTEELIVRPTSETIIGESFSKWINSYRDLPLLINQWANIVRWEMRTRLFLRTAEFLWQEGHTAHATREEAVEETLRILDIYADFAETCLALPVIKGKKTESEKFPGGEATYCFEAMMQDRKALQAGTSHFLGQNFSRASDIRFQSREGKEEFAWTTSWGVTTRLIGALVMAHGDDNGLVLPPRVAPAHGVLLPIYRTDAEREKVMTFAGDLQNRLCKVSYHEAPLRIELDDRDLSISERNWQWIKKGIPLRLEIGPRDIQNQSVFTGRRDQPPHEKSSVNHRELVEKIADILDEIQNNIYSRALEFRNSHLVRIDEKNEFYRYFTPLNSEEPEIHGGFALSHWCGGTECEERGKEELKISIRCIPLSGQQEPGKCIFCQQPSQERVVFAKGY